jgi:hypothetical protein
LNWEKTTRPFGPGTFALAVDSGITAAAIRAIAVSMIARLLIIGTPSVVEAGVSVYTWSMST